MNNPYFGLTLKVHWSPFILCDQSGTFYCSGTVWVYVVLDVGVDR